MWSLDTEALHNACKQYGSGRLPGAYRPDIGAGYAAGSAALVAAVLFAIGTILGDTLGLLSAGDGIVLAMMGGIALPLVVPTAFGVGVLVWRMIPQHLPYFGPLTGVLGVIATYLGAALILAGFLGVLAITGSNGATLPNSILYAFVIAYVAFLLTCWVTLPVGGISGAVYAAVRRDS